MDTGDQDVTDARLVFVYNADSGLVDTLKDYVHKTVSPATYGCNLCGLTYGSFGMKGRWREFAEGLGVPLEFLHRDELRERYDVHDVMLPTVLVLRGDDHEVLISKREIDELWSLDELIGLVGTRVEELRRVG